MGAATQSELEILFKSHGMELKEGNIEILVEAISRAENEFDFLSPDELENISRGIMTLDPASVLIRAGMATILYTLILTGISLYHKDRKDES